MKKTWMLKPLLLCSTMALLASCQEKIAPELSNPASATGPTTTTTTDEKKFYLTLEKTKTGVLPELLGYVLHKANNLGTVECEVEDVIDTPVSLNSTRDITCFVEAEEFALLYHGFSVNAESTPGTCDFIEIEPYTYYQFMPGVSARRNGQKRQVVYFECAQNVTTEALTMNDSISAVATFGTIAAGFNGGNHSALALCGKYVNIDDDGSPLPLSGTGAGANVNISATASVVSLASQSQLCTFNQYERWNGSSFDPVLCDQGRIDVHVVNVSASDTDADTIVDSLIVSGSSSPQTVSCGGNPRNCASGAGVALTNTYLSSGTFAANGPGWIKDIPEDEAGKRPMEVDSKYPSKFTNVYASNFLRQCSGTANFKSRGSFSGSTYDSSVWEAYSQLGINVPGAQEQINGFDVVRLAENPFRAGLPTSYFTSVPVTGNLLIGTTINSMRATPYYTYNCLDKAYDIKARIRLAVREWNRNYSMTTQDFSFVSDAYNPGAVLGGNADYLTRFRMDAGSAVETNAVPASNEYINPSSLINDYFMNDVDDWDDIFSFTNNTGTGTCNATDDINPTDYASPPTLQTNEVFLGSGE